ncbi:MAG: YIP1 family protein [Anaerolineae bacterium]|nr:YIP1 family protein [Anaerolineae bacterium]MDW8173445.1 YIP1 family protein [Anaerolineae bacterium]
MPRDYSDDSSNHPLRDAEASQLASDLQAEDAPHAYSPKPSQPARYTWVEVWTAAVNLPKPSTYSTLLDDPQATARRALVWVYLASLIQLIVQLIVIFSSPGFALALRQSNLDADSTVRLSIFLSVLCVSPFAAFVNVIIFLALAYAVNWLASRNYNAPSRPQEALYAFGASTAPLTLVLALLGMLVGALPLLALLGQLAVLALQGYQIWLYVVATQAVYGLEVRQAALVAMLPSVALLVLQLVLAGTLL